MLKLTQATTLHRLLSTPEFIWELAFQEGYRKVNSFSLGKLVLSPSCKTKIIRNWFKRMTVQEVEIYPQLQRVRLKGKRES